MFADSVLELVTDTGAGLLILNGVTKSSYRCALAAFNDGDSFMYDIRHPENEPSTGITEWEVGIGKLTAAAPGSMTGTLERTTVLASSNAGAKVNFTAGTKILTCKPSASFLDSLSVLGSVGTTGTGLVVLNEEPTLVHPVIASFLNANHTHMTDGVNGGTLDGGCITRGTIYPARLPGNLPYLQGVGMTGTGQVVLMTGGVLTRPLIGDFSGSLHDHQSINGGGTLDASAINTGTFPPARFPQDIRISASPQFAGMLLAQSNNADTIIAKLQNTSNGSAATTALQLTNSGNTAGLVARVYSAGHATRSNVVLLHSATGTDLSLGANGPNTNLQIASSGDILINGGVRPTLNGGGVLVFGTNSTDPTLVVGSPGIWANGSNLYVGKAGSAPLSLTTQQDVSTTGSPVLDGLRLGSSASPPSSGSLLVGLLGVCNYTNAIVQSAGKFTNDGDAQVGNYILRVITTSSTSTPMTDNGLTAGSSNQITMPNNSTYMVHAMITGRRTDVVGDVAAYTVTGLFRRGANAASLVLLGPITKQVIHEEDASWDVDLFADTTNGAPQLLVTGGSGTTIRWVAKVQTVEIKS